MCCLFVACLKLTNIYNQGTNIVGYLLGSATTNQLCNDGDFSAVGDLHLSAVPIVTYMMYVDANCDLTLQYSPDNIRWFDTATVWSFTGGASYRNIDIPSSVGWVRVRVNTTGAHTVNVCFAVNHI